MPKIATVTLNPAIDQTAFVPGFRPGEVNRVEFEQSDPGGKGVNVASFLSDFGYSSVVSGFLGADNSEIFQRLFVEKKIEDQFIRIPGKTRVNVKIIDTIGHNTTDVNFPGQTADDSDVEKLTTVLDDLSGRCDWFVISGSIPAGISASIYMDIVTRLKQKDRMVVLDASGEGLRHAISAAPFAIKPNIAELQELVGDPLNDQAAIGRAARKLVDCGIHTVVVSMGAQGAIFVEANEAILARPPRVEVKSTVGAGDAMVAGLITAKLRNLSLSECARLSTAFSAGAVTQLGPRLPAPNVVESLMEEVAVSTL